MHAAKVARERGLNINGKYRLIPPEFTNLSSSPVTVVTHPIDSHIRVTLINESNQGTTRLGVNSVTVKEAEQATALGEVEGIHAKFASRNQPRAGGDASATPLKIPGGSPMQTGARGLAKVQALPRM